MIDGFAITRHFTQADKMSPIVRVLFPDWSGLLTAVLPLVRSLLQADGDQG